MRSSEVLVAITLSDGTSSNHTTHSMVVNVVLEAENPSRPTCFCQAAVTSKHFLGLPWTARCSGSRSSDYELRNDMRFLLISLHKTRLESEIWASVNLADLFDTFKSIMAI